MKNGIQFAILLHSKKFSKNLFGESYETTSGEMFSTIQYSPCFRIYFGFIVGCGDGKEFHPFSLTLELSDERLRKILNKLFGEKFSLKEILE